LIFLKDIFISDEDKWYYREFIRKNFLKRKVKWNLKGEVILKQNDADLTHIVIQEGWARVKGKIDELKKLQNEAQKMGKGFFNKELEARDLPVGSDREYNLQI